MPSHNVVKRDAGGQKGKLLCCKDIFNWIKANLAEIQLKKHQNVQKTLFLAKSSRNQWVKDAYKRNPQKTRLTLNFFFGFVTTVTSCHAPTIWKLR